VANLIKSLPAVLPGTLQPFQVLLTVIQCPARRTYEVAAICALKNGWYVGLVILSNLRIRPKPNCLGLSKTESHFLWTGIFR
jgi:hypothetical protein